MRAIKEHAKKPLDAPKDVTLAFISVRATMPHQPWNRVGFNTPKLDFRNPAQFAMYSPWAYASVGGMSWFTSCAAYLISDLHVNASLGDIERRAVVAAHMLVKLHPPMIGAGFGQQNVFYLARDPRDTSPQDDVIEILERLGFEQIKGSEMINNVHNSKLSIYARLVR